MVCESGWGSRWAKRGAAVYARLDDGSQEERDGAARARHRHPCMRVLGDVRSASVYDLQVVEMFFLAAQLSCVCVPRRLRRARAHSHRRADELATADGAVQCQTSVGLLCLSVFSWN